MGLVSKTEQRKKMNYITRDQAIAIVGQATVDAVDAENCDFSGHWSDDDTMIQFHSSKKCVDMDGNDVTLQVIYWQDKNEVDANEDLSNLTWDPMGYRIH